MLALSLKGTAPHRPDMSFRGHPPPTALLRINNSFCAKASHAPHTEKKKNASKKHLDWRLKNEKKYHYTVFYPRARQSFTPPPHGAYVRVPIPRPYMVHNGLWQAFSSGLTGKKAQGCGRYTRQVPGYLLGGYGGYILGYTPVSTRV